MVVVALQRADSRRPRESWQSIVSNLFGMSETRLRDDNAFRGDVLRSRIGDLDFTTVACSSEFVERAARHIRQDNRDVVVLVNVKRGDLHLRQGKSECRLSSGTSLLYAPNRPFTWEHANSTEVQNVAMPRELLAAAVPQLDRHLLVPYDSRSGMWRVAKDFVGSLTGQMRRIPDNATGTYARQLIDLIAIAVEADTSELEVGNSSVRTATLRRCVGYVRQHLHDPQLAPAQIASAAGISVRYLHRIFSEAGTSVGEVVRLERLKLCHSQLADPINLKFRIAEIAYRAGFRSQAHFAHAFRTNYGISPSDRRKQALPPS
jgi:AraC-like DNA-binding protein